MHENSLFAFEQIKHELTDRQKEVYDGLEILLQATAKELSLFIHRPLESVTGRLNELMYDKQLIKICGKELNRSVYCLRKSTDDLNKRQLTPYQKMQQLKSWMSLQGLYVDTNKAIEKINELIN